eukprot:5036377-Amphidinium_carterae.1
MKHLGEDCHTKRTRKKRLATCVKADRACLGCAFYSCLMLAGYTEVFSTEELLQCAPLPGWFGVMLSVFLCFFVEQCDIIPNGVTAE